MVSSSEASAVEPSSGLVVVIDDHELFSATLVMALREHGFDASQFPVSKLPELPRLPEGRRAGLAVLDLDLGPNDAGCSIHGAQLVGALRVEGWAALIVSGSTDDLAIAAAIAAGAIGSVSKSSSLDSLVASVLTAVEGRPLMTEQERQRWVIFHRRHQAREAERARLLGRLTPREREVLDLLGEGLRANEIAREFVVSMTTVRTQIRSILSKLECNSQIQAVALARHPTQRETFAAEGVVDRG